MIFNTPNTISLVCSILILLVCLWQLSLGSRIPATWTIFNIAALVVLIRLFMEGRSFEKAFLTYNGGIQCITMVGLIAGCCWCSTQLKFKMSDKAIFEVLIYYFSCFVAATVVVLFINGWRYAP